MSKEFDGFAKTGSNQEIEDAILNHCKEYNIDQLDAVKLFPVLVRRQWLKRFLAHHELFLKTLEIPGDIAELGVFRGLGLMTWANFLESYCIGDRTKIVYGFDNWKGFTEFNEKDGNKVDEVHKNEGDFSPAPYKRELEDAIKIFDSDRFIPWKARIKLIEGNIQKTVPQFTKDNPGVRFSLVHFDCDMYDPTIAALESFWDRLSVGGLCIFDEYGIKEWAGETKAVDEFFKDKNVKIKTIPWNNSPAAYIVKGE